MASSQSAQSSVVIGASSSTKPTVVRIKAKTRNKDLFQHFDLCEMSIGVDKARCKGCGIFLKPESNYTLRSHLTNHCVMVKYNLANDQAQISTEWGVWNSSPDMVREMMGNVEIQEITRAARSRLEVYDVAARPGSWLCLRSANHQVVVVDDLEPQQEGV
ncbi:hypothetical protein R6Q57_001321 [Mikania cordata]